ncbi:PREDICTED: cytochrome b-c1 complex subunit 8 [Ceratosolen solmsi marchali]|uniref:Cytochrome b-c1 complex subunit 8 n=1 Tax=Ceratosolen solmsi marchali TaxID=326594 RepID=A0AAJ6VKZ3_9HYME|nr:PREDICTED: cytochrome b-c1 complex subunit 8 [Ceratosolen solmsi marchali]
MHMVFGNLAKITRVIYYRLSPYEQKPFVGIIKHGFPNVLRRLQENIFIVTPPFIFTTLLMSWADSKNLELSVKNPKDYEHEK